MKKNLIFAAMLFTALSFGFASCDNVNEELLERIEQLEKQSTLGVMADKDGVYYWTQNGTWLLDANGDKVRVTGEDGKDGEKGEKGDQGIQGEKGDKGDTGEKGETGAKGDKGDKGDTGSDGVSPRLKIENGDWYVSYDRGITWELVGQATGDKGDEGDSKFQSVTQDEENVYLTLADGTVIIIAKGGNGSGEGTPDPDEGEEGGDEGGSSSSTTGTENGYDYVDLGLPSGLKWATCNVGTTKPEEYGNYYAWGEVEPKEVYSWSTYKFMDSNINAWNGVTKYTFADGQTSGVWYDSEGNFIGDNKTVLDPEDDAASVNMGGTWRMPTKEEIAELIDECTWTWTDDYNGTGVAGRIVTSKSNDNAIFLPAAGFRLNSDLYYAGSYGFYWSSSLITDYSDYAYYLYFNSGSVSWDNRSRFYGQSVRGVFSH